MEPLFKYSKSIVSAGLIPITVCMILCMFFQEATALYVCSLASIVYVLYRLATPYAHHTNLPLLHGTLVLVITSVIKGISGDMLIPDQTTPITLEILMLSFSLFYLVVPELYLRQFNDLHYKGPASLNYGSMLAIAILSAIHLFIFCIIYLFFSPLSHQALYILTHITPPLIYIFCLIINYLLVRSLNIAYKKIPLLRIAIICRGKIYVAPRNRYQEETGKLDTPIEECILSNEIDLKQLTKKITHEYHIPLNKELRFSLNYQITLPDGISRTILLFLISLDNEKQIHIEEGRFVTLPEMEKHADQYSSFLLAEKDHLNTIIQTRNTYE